MLKVYAVEWCPHCRNTIEFLKRRKIDFEYFDMDHQPEDIERKIIEVNGGIDWVVPTMEFNGKWRPGQIFNEEKLLKDLKDMGVLS